MKRVNNSAWLIANNSVWLIARSPILAILRWAFNAKIATVCAVSSDNEKLDSLRNNKYIHGHPL
jgi:hypothetical protein